MFSDSFHCAPLPAMLVIPAAYLLMRRCELDRRARDQVAPT
ncbi:MAG TPA: hypothetical protein VGD81_00020 [Opitutaceae bacterium]